MKKELFEELNNTCIEVKSAIHGFKVIEFWKSTGVIETENFSGQSIGAYYGLFDGIFTAKMNIRNERILTIDEAIIIRDKYILNKEETIEQLQTRIKELEGTIENNVTELIDSQYSSIIGQWMITKCCSFLVKDNFNYCPNCGRKIKK